MPTGNHVHHRIGSKALSDDASPGCRRTRSPDPADFSPLRPWPKPSRERSRPLRGVGAPLTMKGPSPTKRGPRRDRAGDVVELENEVTVSQRHVADVNQYVGAKPCQCHAHPPIADLPSKIAIGAAHFFADGQPTRLDSVHQLQPSLIVVVLCLRLCN
jgi:hypothetical protein